MNTYINLIGTLTRAQLDSFLTSIGSRVKSSDIMPNVGGILYDNYQVGTFLVIRLRSGAFCVEFEETKNHFLYIWSQSEQQFYHRLLKGIRFVARDLKKNPQRANKIRLLINA